MTTTTRPDRSEAAEYYFTYIDKVPAGDIRTVLETQSGEVVAQMEGITDARSLLRYAPGKWSIRQVLSHINDAERLFAFSAFWSSRSRSSARDTRATTSGSCANGTCRSPGDVFIEKVLPCQTPSPRKTPPPR